jgi:hypothetical protein
MFSLTRATFALAAGALTKAAAFIGGSQPVNSTPLDCMDACDSEDSFPELEDDDEPVPRPETD